MFPAIGYAHPDQSHFTSRHFWEVGALDPQAGTGWLGRLLDVIGDDENAMQGLSLDGALLPSLATARVPVATLSSPTDYGFDSHNVWDVPGELLNDAIGSLGGLSADPDPFLAQASRTIDAGRRAAPPARPLRRQGRPGAHQPEGEVPGRATSAAGSPGSQRCSTRTSRSAPQRSPAPAPTTRTPTSRGPLQDGAQADRRRRSPPSSPTSSGAASRAAC